MKTISVFINVNKNCQQDMFCVRNYVSMSRSFYHGGTNDGVIFLKVLLTLWILISYYCNRFTQCAHMAVHRKTENLATTWKGQYSEDDAKEWRELGRNCETVSHPCTVWKARNVSLMLFISLFYYLWCCRRCTLCCDV